MSLYRCNDDNDKISYSSIIAEQKSNSCPPWPCECPDDHEQEHVHEVQGSVEIAEREEDPHNHRFATVTGEAKPLGIKDHFHEVKFRTDFYENHYHEFKGRTGGAIQVGDRHVHFLESITEEADGHQHNFRLATFIDNPIEE